MTHQIRMEARAVAKATTRRQRTTQRHEPRTRDGPPLPYSQAGPPGIGPPGPGSGHRDRCRDGPGGKGPEHDHRRNDEMTKATTMRTMHRRQTMKTQINNIFRGGGLLAALFLMGTSSVYAATTAGTDVTNTAAVTFRTAAGGTTDQSGTGDSETFETDRLVNLTVTGGADVDVVPGQVGPSLTLVRSFDVTNTTNGVIDILLSTADGTDQFDETVSIRFEAGAGQPYGADETVGTTIDDVAAGATYTVHVYSTSTISTSQVNGDVDQIYLVAQAADPTSSVAITADSAADTALGIENVVNDGDGDAGAVDAARNGAHTDVVQYTIRTATVTLSKSSFALYDSINCSVAPGLQDLSATCDADGAFRIPGATVVYKLIVTNVDTAENVDATQVNISDALDAASTTYVAGSLWRTTTTAGAAAGTACYSVAGALTDGADADEGSYAADTVTLAEGTGLTEGNAVVYCYKVTID